MLIAQGSTVFIHFFLSDAANPAGIPGIAPIDLIILQNGAIVTNTQLLTPANPVSGWYWFQLAPPITNTLGTIAYEVTAPDPVNPTGPLLVATANDIQVVPSAVLNPTPTGGPIAIQRNVAIAAFPFPMYTPFPNATLAPGLPVSGQRSLDGGSFVTLAGPVAEIGAGWYSTPLTAAETNGAVIALRFSAPGAQDTLVTIATQVL